NELTYRNGSVTESDSPTSDWGGWDVARGTRSWLAIAGALTIGIVMAAPAGATAGGDPPGNNGTIKIDGKPFDDAPDNEPRPACVFQVDFYGFDAGNLDADLT